MKEVLKVERRTYVPSQTTNRMISLPFSQQINQYSPVKLTIENLREQVEIRYEHRLQNNTNIGCVEKFDWNLCFVAFVLLMDEGYADLKPLQIDDDEEYQQSPTEGK